MQCDFCKEQTDNEVAICDSCLKDYQALEKALDVLSKRLWEKHPNNQERAKDNGND